MDPRNLSRGLTFDRVATGYDRHRPRYPHEMFDDLARIAGVNEDSRILEVGCGPGVATEAMVSCGWSVLAVDPGAHLAQVAREKFGDERFAVEVATFDEWDPRGRRFDLVLSAAAFHWVAPHLRWVKAADVLVERGVIALAGNKALAAGTFHEFDEATRGLRVTHGVDDQREAPSLEELSRVIASHDHDVGALWEAISPQGSDVVAGARFAAPDVRLYPWTTTYSTAEALGLLATYSRFLAMESTSRTTLFSRLAAIIDEHFGGALTRHYVSVMALARRRDG